MPEHNASATFYGAFVSVSQRQTLLRKCRSGAGRRSIRHAALCLQRRHYSSITYTRLDAALAPLDHLICYAVKANSNRAILKLLADAGAGFDIVSGGELFRAIKAGADPQKCTFAGVGKSRDEIEYALEQGVHSFNVESEAELDHIDKIAGAKKMRAPIALRVNPDVDPHTHKYISTGSHENKFGIALRRCAGRLRTCRQNGATSTSSACKCTSARRSPKRRRSRPRSPRSRRSLAI